MNGICLVWFNSVGSLVLEEQNERHHLEGKPQLFLFVVGTGLCSMGAVYVIMVSTSV